MAFLAIQIHIWTPEKEKKKNKCLVKLTTFLSKSRKNKWPWFMMYFNFSYIKGRFLIQALLLQQKSAISNSSILHIQNFCNGSRSDLRDLKCSSSSFLGTHQLTSKFYNVQWWNVSNLFVGHRNGSVNLFWYIHQIITKYLNQIDSL